MLPVNFTPYNRDLRRTSSARPAKGYKSSDDKINPLSYVISRNTFEEVKSVDGVETPGEIESDANTIPDITIQYKQALGRTLFAVHHKEAFKRAMSLFQSSTEIISSFDGQYPIKEKEHALATC